ncbi:hypothetical protein DH2020_001966 [Rehmannia glutinosa]|uniref:Histone-lysine N-methyltransferase n=1 Tax=Rehmannia glutinosa TaxID=99300 RepID=A0ABR0XSY6_REHGL
MDRPMVVGKYGIISNGNPSKPTKIFPLWKILKTPASHAEKSNRNADDNDKQKSLSVKVKETSVRRVKETALSKKVLRSQVKKVGTHNLPHIEPEPRDPNGEMETASCLATNESDDLSYTSLKCNNHGITDSKPGVQLKKKYKEGNDFKVANSSVMKNSISLCQTTNRCWEELSEDAVDCRVETNEMNNAKRCSEKHHRVYWSSGKDECDLLFECNRFLIKGLQSEGEAVGNESVSFRGRCVLHATSHMFMPEGDSESLQPGEKFMTCARTEGYKGRKREGFLHNNPRDANGNAGCLVPQEQLNAWLHIHRQKPQRKGRPKLSSSIVDSDCRKAYARYKQSKGWKHLVVYKSGIHALGLYTSHFISRGAMVVEYVGEIVGLRVADRRENEYHSGKKLQHKSACYFFRIDKEHIIDATRKGGIARFVNHSCQPNCVARVISVRNDKKVIFFAQRDIYPGEEITYDYHFNHEDEGEKIACYCNSKNCRRYLN